MGPMSPPPCHSLISPVGIRYKAVVDDGFKDILHLLEGNLERLTFVASLWEPEGEMNATEQRYCCDGQGGDFRPATTSPTAGHLSAYHITIHFIFKAHFTTFIYDGYSCTNVHHVQITSHSYPTH